MLLRIVKELISKHGFTLEGEVGKVLWHWLLEGEFPEYLVLLHSPLLKCSHIHP